ncbi:MAG: hypothetical protein OEV00_02330 [Acidobacteriota bacterium]|nr:hypothetical protein [Acidobacteriota bacterium]MDH3784146.1 hypothetical protein [Acidobacteriota bacterium]
MNQDGNNSMVFELIDAVLRNWWTVVAGVCLGLAGSMIALDHIPKAYRAEGQIRTTPQQIPDEFVQTTVTQNMAHLLVVLRGEVFDQASMEEVLDQFYETVDEPTRRARKIEQLRKQIDVGALGGSGLFTLRVVNTDAVRAANVVNLLMQRFIEQNNAFRQNQAGDTAAELQLLADEWREKWKESQTILDAFVKEHPFQTYDYLELNRQSLATSREELKANGERQDALGKQVRELEAIIALESSSGDVAALPTSAADPLALQIKSIDAEIQALLLRWTESHPNIKSRRAQRDELVRRREAWLADQPTAANPDQPEGSPDAARLVELKEDLSKVRAREVAIAADIRRYEYRIRNTPEVQTKATELSNERDILRGTYEKKQRDLEQARVAVQLETRELGAQFKIVSLADVPLKPIQPQPLKVYLLGLAAGCLLFIVPVPLNRMLHPLILSEAGMRMASEVPILVSIPQLTTQENRSERIRRGFRNFSLAILSSGVLAAVVVLLRAQG